MSEGLVGVAIMIALVFKSLHLSGAAMLIMLSSLGLVLLLIDKLVQNRGGKLISLKTITPILGIMFVFAVVFKIMHFKGAGILMLISTLGISIALAIQAYCMRKSKAAIFPALYSLVVFFALFQIMHWPKPPYLLYAIWFVFIGALSIYMYSKGTKLKNTNASLSNNYSLIGAFALSSFVIGILNQLVQMRKIDFIKINQLFLIDCILFFAIFMMISKTLKSETDQDDQKLLQTLKGIFAFILVLMFLVKAK